MTRQSPEQSATLYKIGTKKKGNDGNIWIVVENKNGVKRWKLHRKPTIVKSTTVEPTTVTSATIKSTSIKQPLAKKSASASGTEMVSLGNMYDMYGMPKLELTGKNLIEWSSNYSKTSQEKFLNFVKHTIPQIEKLGINFFLCPIGLSNSGHYFVDTVHQIILDIYDKNIDNMKNDPCIILKLTVNRDNVLSHGDFYAYHWKINKELKMQLEFLMKKETKNIYSWNGRSDTGMHFVFES